MRKPDFISNMSFPMGRDLGQPTGVSVVQSCDSNIVDLFFGDRGDHLKWAFYEANLPGQEGQVFYISNLWKEKHCDRFLLSNVGCEQRNLVDLWSEAAVNQQWRLLKIGDKVKTFGIEAVSASQCTSKTTLSCAKSEHNNVDLWF